jgi:predicted RNase H-like HicB family nuclease
MAKYTAIFEQAEDGTWSGYAPDLPTILAMGDTLEEAKENMRTGIQLWIEDMNEQGLPIPKPSTEVVNFEVPA